MDSVDNQRKLLLEATRKLRQLSLTEGYATDYELLRSVPGVGMITAMSLATEMEDIKRFSCSDKLAGYIGLVPTSHSSGEKDKKGEMTFRGQMQLRSKIIECFRSDEGADAFTQLHSIVDTAKKNGMSRYEALLAVTKR
ncbi:transposase [Bacteroides graminisolvens]|uniref:transposase n=1 Tax=Bacteroides graminisolvens TaxID=477666 RepID=UPI0023F14E8E|nr:transposase [Bacteroides graminisolvens]MDD3210866.1 transposase [Bacteroides graminisolvens]